MCYITQIQTKTRINKNRFLCIYIYKERLRYFFFRLFHGDKWSFNGDWEFDSSSWLDSSWFNIGSCLTKPLEELFPFILFLNGTIRLIIARYAAICGSSNDVDVSKQSISITGILDFCCCCWWWWVCISSSPFVFSKSWLLLLFEIFNGIESSCIDTKKKLKN